MRKSKGNQSEKRFGKQEEKYLHLCFFHPRILAPCLVFDILPNGKYFRQTDELDSDTKNVEDF